MRSYNLGRALAIAIAAIASSTMPVVAAASVIKHVFVIVMENTSASELYFHKRDAPYINIALLPNYAFALNFVDELPTVGSEPHYIWMEAGTNAFPDATFTLDGPPSQTNSTSSTDHLVTQIKTSALDSWVTYQESVPTGTCPIASPFPYAARHNPFVFFQDVSGSPPSSTNLYCIQHTKPYSLLSNDLLAGNIPGYVFITPNLCHDMHGHLKCKTVARYVGQTQHAQNISAGDTWLRAHLPPIIDWASKNAGVIFLVWDENDKTGTLPFLVIGPGAKKNYRNRVTYNHSSIIKSVEEILGLPILATVTGSNDLTAFFTTGSFP